jgi:hypothetical protein
MSASIGRFIKSEISHAVDKVQESLKATRNAHKQKQFAKSVSFRSAKVKAEVVKAPRKGMSEAERELMVQARKAMSAVAKPLKFDSRQTWARNACEEIAILVHKVDSEDHGPAVVRQALKDAVAGLGSKKLQKIRARAVLLNAWTHMAFERTDEAGSGGWKHPTRDTIRVRKLALKLMVEACNDCLIEKGFDSQFLGSQKTEEAAYVGKPPANQACIDWLVEPSRNLVTALGQGLPSGEIQTLVEELALGQKTFGDEMTLRALFDDFIGQRPRSENDIWEIGRRAKALLDVTKGKKAFRELNRTARLMLMVHDAYYMSLNHEIVKHPTASGNTARLNKNVRIPQPVPTEADKAWAWSHLTGGDKEVLDVVMAWLSGVADFEGMIGPIERLADKLKWSDTSKIWNPLLAMFEKCGDLRDTTRLRDFGRPSRRWLKSWIGPPPRVKRRAASPMSQSRSQIPTRSRTGSLRPRRDTH